MRKVLKLISALVAVVLMLTMVSATASTNYEVMDDAIYIASASVPEDATAYALDMFSQFNVTVLTSLGFTADEASNLKVSQGICANIIDRDSDDIAIYYFPVLCGDEVLAMITLSWYNDQYNFQFGRTAMAEALNDIETSQSNPARIFVSENAYYCVTDNGVTVLETTANANESKIDNEIAVLSENSISADVISATESIVVLSYNTAIDVDAYINDTTVELTGVIRNVAIVSNETLTDDTGTYGVCWAAAAGSIADYYMNGCATSMGETNKWFMLQLRLDEYGSYVGYVSTIKYYIEMFTGVTMTTVNSMLTWSQVKTAIYTNNAPCCTIWKRTDSTGSHAMVLCGYYYATSDPTDSSHYWLRVMDPNLTYYMVIPYSSSFIYSYTSGSATYSWTQSIIKS